ncbi:DedA family protein [Brucellaceae bacterium C25G]
MLSDFIQTVLNIVEEYSHLAPLIAFLLSFCESLAFLSLLAPATTILIGMGALIGVAGLDFFTIWFAAAFGAFLGDWISYWLGRRYKTQILNIWPLSKYPDMARKGELFFKRWGTWSVFIGRFWGPLRAVVPLMAGIMNLPLVLFQLANFTSAAIWAFVMLAPGAFTFNARWLDWITGLIA